MKQVPDEGMGLPRGRASWSVWLAGAIAATGLAGLGGWIFDVGILKSVLPGLVAMKANTAVGFLTSGLALLLLTWPGERKRFRLIAGIGSAFVALLGLASLSQYLFGWNLGIDQLLFKEQPGAAFTTHLGRMAPPTAFNFALLGLALTLSSFGRRPRLGQSLALIAGLVGLLSMLGYFFGNQAIYFFPSWTQMAVHTAVCFVLLSVSILLYYYRSEPNILLSSDPVSRPVGLGFGLVFFILLVVGMISIQSVTMMNESARGIEHTHQVIQELEQYRAKMKTAESAQRGYAISEKAVFLERYQADLGDAVRLLSQVRELTKDNRGQQLRLVGLDSLTRLKIGFSHDVVAARQWKGKAAALIASGSGQRLMSRIDAAIDGMTGEEARLLAQRREQVRRALAITVTMTLLGGLLAALVVVFSGRLVAREMEARRGAEQALQAANEELEASNQQVTAANQELSALNQELQTAQEELEHHRDQLQLMVNEATVEIQKNYQELKEEAEVRRRAEEYLKDSEQLSRAIMEQSPIGVSVRNRFGRLERYNDAWQKLWAMTDEDVKKDLETERTRLAPDQKDGYLGEWAAEVERVYKKGGILHVPELLLSKPELGGDRFISQYFYALTGKDGGVDRVVILTQDITERKRAEEELRQMQGQLETNYAELEAANQELQSSEEELRAAEKGLRSHVEELHKTREILRENEERYRSLFDNSLLGVYRTTPEGRILLANPALIRMLKFGSFEEMSWRNLEKEGWPDFSPSRTAFKEKIEAEGVVTGWETMWENSAGEPVNIRESARAIRDANGKTLYYDGMVEDITGRKVMEQELLQAQKMEAIGHLAGGVAHDFNNMLAGIVGNAELLQLKVYGQKELEAYVDNIIKASGHAANLTKQLLAFARKGQYQQAPVNVHQVIAETLGILGNTIDRRIKVEQRLRANPAVILGDHSQLENALMNLGINARDAMPEGGKLIFSTDMANLDKEYLRNHKYKVEPGPYIQISVEDTGCGMTDEAKRHLFEPFFTTKEKGQGTGLGLAGVYGCVKNHEGSIEVYSELGRGTAVKIYLPVYGGLPAAGDQDFIQMEFLRNTAGTGSILIVDDEEMIRSIAAQILKNAGYHVHACADGQEAVELYSRQHQNIDLVIMDMVMPKLDGREAFGRMRKINPKVKVLLSSGFSEDGDAQAILQDGALGFIQKPYRSAELLLRVQQALQ
ncbi:CHASE3 domain-containing protein [candidate division TA06 bacterium]|uniref:histidine kinase n=1 Tax=candidate division TA06 bacterium TaxID=2250710 RepID=A0A933I7Y3_UNCT6|nr:CHASE3 domain-containing protein [candidate division TA06 bacterium]